MVTAPLRVEYVFDAEVQTWGFAVPALHIVGGGCLSREEAIQHAAEAVAFALQEADQDRNPEADVGYLDVKIA